MPRLSLRLSSTLILVSLATAASAYATDPEPVRFSQVAQPTQSVTQIAEPTDTCAKELTPALATLLGLEPAWTKTVEQSANADVACLTE